MELIKSQLELIDFVIINSRYKYIDPDPEETGIDVKSIFNKYEMDVDFMPKPFNDQYAVYVKISVNEGENPIIGYSIFAEGVAIFNISDKDQLSDDIISGFLWNSGVMMALSNLRGFVSNMTCYFPFGKLLFPSVDLTALIEKKKLILEEEKNSSIKKPKKLK